MTANNTAVKTDIRVENHGSLIILRPVSESGAAWLAENISEDGYQPMLPAVLVEPRYLDAVIDGAINDGLNLGQ